MISNKIRKTVQFYENSEIKITFLSVRKLLEIIIFLLFSVNLFSQSVTKVLVSGIAGNTAHDTNVLKSFLLGYSSFDGTQYSSQIDLHVDNSAYSAIQYANQNKYQIVIRSYTGLNSAVNDTAKNYPNVLLFMPAGSNGFYYVCNLDIPNSAVVSTGAGVDTLATGYKVEFFSIDPITGTNLSSFSNGYIAGQIAFLANRYNKTVQQARIIARNNSYVKNQSTFYVQYGTINLAQAIASTDSSLNALPVELTNFSASISKTNIVLNWSTSTEVNNYGFEVERSHIINHNYNNWIKIGFVKGYGNSNSPQNYSYGDNSCSNGDFIYRLKQIDNNGNYKYSIELKVRLNKSETFTLYQNYPNPFNPITTVKYEVYTRDQFSIKVYNFIGKLVTTLFEGNKEPGNYEMKIDGSKLASGIYFVTLRSNTHSNTIKMILLD